MFFISLLEFNVFGVQSHFLGNSTFALVFTVVSKIDLDSIWLLKL